MVSFETTWGYMFENAIAGRDIEILRDGTWQELSYLNDNYVDGNGTLHNTEFAIYYALSGGEFMAAHESWWVNWRYAGLPRCERCECELDESGECSWCKANPPQPPKPAAARVYDAFELLIEQAKPGSFFTVQDVAAIAQTDDATVLECAAILSINFDAQNIHYYSAPPAPAPTLQPDDCDKPRCSYCGEYCGRDPVDCEDMGGNIDYQSDDEIEGYIQWSLGEQFANQHAINHLFAEVL